MNHLITYDTLRLFAYSNDKICKQPISGIVLSFFGLGTTQMCGEDSPDSVFFAERGILYVTPYCNPWSWMNRQAVDYTDEVLDVLIEKYGLSERIPIVSTGGSMGGLAALVYTKYAKRTPVACVANCPVCDLLFHYTERPDLPRTLYSAFGTYDGTLEDAMKTASPLHLVDRMPRVPYHIFHCDADKAVRIDCHSDKFVAAMREHGHHVTYDIIPGRGHCDLTPEMHTRFLEYCEADVKAAEGR